MLKPCAPRCLFLAVSMLVMLGCSGQPMPQHSAADSPGTLPRSSHGALELPSDRPARVRSPALPTGLIAASAYRNSRWDLYAMEPDGRLHRRLTFGDGQYRAPAWSPDGTQIAFESNRLRNWDVYVMNVDGTNLKRLTTQAGFDGSPRWARDGTRLAYVSDRDGDLDIWSMNSDGSDPVNLTPRSTAADFDPTWSPDSKQIAFTSLRDGNKEIYVMQADGTQPRNLTHARATDEEHPSWAPADNRIAFVSARDGTRDVHIVVAGAEQPWERLTQSGDTLWPAWSPDGTALAFIRQSEGSQQLQVLRLGEPNYTAVTTDGPLFRQPDWNAHARVAADEAGMAQPAAPLYVERVTPNPPNMPDRYNFVRLNGVNVIVPLLSDRVDDSFAALRERVLKESGRDFLGVLSEAYRPLDFRSIGSDYLSWHKAGRAIDVQWDNFDSQRLHVMEVAREDLGGETYWRIFLRAARQDGSQGEPLRQSIWDLSPAARRRAGRAGGLIKGVLPGYYVDFTELARQYGWYRIPSLTLPDFDWHRDFWALEYWHYQKTDGLTWWDALHEVYAPEQIGDLFTFDRLIKDRLDLETIVTKGIPLPPAYTKEKRAGR